MKKLGMLGIIGGAALLTAAPFSLQWSQENVALSMNGAEARVAGGVHRRIYRRTYRRAAYAAGYGYGSYYGYGFSVLSQLLRAAAVLELLRAARTRAYCPLPLSPIPLQLLPATLCVRKLLRS
jgi:hypothetical protein